MSHINKELQTLANINQDACQFYEEAQDKVEKPQLKATFQNLKTLHESVVVNLQEHIRASGETPDTDETAAGEVRGFWGKLMASISNDVDATLVRHLEETEDRCLHKVEGIMEDGEVPAATKALLQKEHQTLQKSHDYMKALKDCMEAA